MCVIFCDISLSIFWPKKIVHKPEIFGHFGLSPWFILILPPIKGQARLATTSPLPCLMVEPPGILEIHLKDGPKTPPKKIIRRKSLGNPVGTFSLQGIVWPTRPFSALIDTEEDAMAPVLSSRCGASRQGGVEKLKKRLISEILTFFREFKRNL